GPPTDCFAIAYPGRALTQAHPPRPGRTIFTHPPTDCFTIDTPGRVFHRAAFSRRSDPQMIMSSSFRFLEDIALADITFEAEGNSIEALFPGATQALVEIMADPLTVKAVWNQRSIKTEAVLEDLLVEWLSEIVYWKDAAGVVFSEVPLTLTRVNDHWRLEATLIGAPVDPATQALRNDVKGITR